MAIKDYLEFRELAESEEKKVQSNLQVAKIGSELNCLENDPEQLFKLTYPSQLIKDLIEFVNSNMKNNKMRYRDNAGAVIIYGNYATGKTHALLAVYNLFSNYDLASEWLNEHNIKFNKFNAFAIKNKSNSCIVSLTEDAGTEGWVPIFEKLGKEKLLSGEQEPPSSSVLRRLAKNGDTAIFIDDLDEFFLRLRQAGEEEATAKNKEFLANLLSEVTKNDNLIVFISASGVTAEVQELLDSHQVIMKDTKSLSQKNKFIFYRLFDEIKNQQFRTNIEPALDAYLEAYEDVGFEIEDTKEFRENLINDYPFHPDLLEVLDAIYQNHRSEIMEYDSEINILADLITEYEAKDLLIVSDLPVEIMQPVFPKLYNGLEAELKRGHIRQQGCLRQVLNTIFLYTVVDNKTATKENILKAVIRPQMDYEINDFQHVLDELAVQGNYVEFEEDIYRIKPKKSLDMLLKEQKEEISQQEIQTKIKEYITDSILNNDYKFYSDNNWSDNPELDYVLLLEAPTEVEKLQEFLEEYVYQDLNYENSVVFVTPSQDILTEQFQELASDIIAINNIIEQQHGEEKEKLSERLKAQKKELESLLKESFGYYLKWDSQAQQLGLQKIEVDLSQITDVHNLVIDKAEIKEFIINYEDRIINLAELFAQTQKDRKMPIIPAREDLDDVIEELAAEKQYIFSAEEDKLYKSLSDLIAERKTEINNEQAQNKLLTYLRQEVFGPEYKIYGQDEIPDQPELQYVVLLNDVIEDNSLRNFLEEKIYSGREYKNSLLILKSQDNIFSTENINLIKEEISLEKLVKEWNQREKVIDLLEEKRNEVISQLQERFGDYLMWTTSGEEIMLEKSTLDVNDFTIDKLISTKIGFIKEAVIKRINQLDSSIKTEDLLSEFKKDRTNPVIDAATFYNIIDELAEEGRIHIDKETEEIYSQFLISIREEMDKLSTTELKESVAYFVRENLFEKDYKIWAYEELKDGPELEYVLIIEQPEEELSDFLEQKIYAEKEFQNSIVVLRSKEEVYTTEVLDKMRKLKAVQNLKDQGKIEIGEELVSEEEQELINLLEDKFAYYEQWLTTGDELQLEEQEIDLSNDLTAELEVALDDLKEHLRANLRERKFGIDIEELFLDYRRFRNYPQIINKELFNQAVEELIAKQKIINAEEENKVYGNTSALIKSTVSEVESKEAKQELVLYIRNELFNEEYNVFGYDELEDTAELQYLLLLGSFKNLDKLQEILEQKLYQDREYKNNIVLYSSREDVFEEKFVNKMKLVMGVQRAQEKINWEPRQIGRILDKRKESLNQKLKAVFGNYLYWVEDEGKLKLTAEELDVKLTAAELAAEIKLSVDDLQQDIKERLQELEGITPQELRSYYKRFRDYPIVIDEQDFDQALDNLKAAEQVSLDEQGALYLNPLLKAEQKIDKFDTAAAKEELSYFIRDNLFAEDYKILGYDELKDNPKLEYVLLLEEPKGDLSEFLKQELYQGVEFQNSFVVLRAKEEIYTAEVLAQTKKIMAVKEVLEQNDNLDFSEDKILNLKAELIEMLENKFAYYEQWTANESGLELEEQELGLVKIPEQIEVEFVELKKHLAAELKKRDSGISKEDLFLDYRRFRDYPLLVEKELFEQAIAELIADGEIITTVDDNQIYSNINDIIEKEKEELRDKEVKQELVLYIRNELFNGEYNVFGYDELADNVELKYLLLLGSFKNKDKLQQILESKLYQDRQYKNNILLYSSREDIFQTKYVDKMKLLLAAQTAQDKINSSETELESILDKRREELNELLKETFGEYVYWETVDGTLQLKTTPINNKLSPAELREEVKVDLDTLKEDISQSVKELDGITIEALLENYKKFRKHPIVIEEKEFHQALEELENEEKVFVAEDDTVHLSPLVKAEERIDEFELEAAQQKLAQLVRDNLFAEDYKIFGYDDLEDNPDLEYVLLFDYPEENLSDYLSREIYDKMQFANSIVLLRPKNDIYTTEAVTKTKKLLAVEAMEREEMNYPEKFISELKAELVSLIADDVIYYEKWINNDEQELQLVEKEVSITELPEILAPDLNALKEDIRDKLQSKELGITKEELFLEYRQYKEYPLIINQEQFEQAITELISEKKVVTTKEEDKIYGSTSALIKSTVNEIDSKEAKQELVLYIRDQLFNEEYKVFGYDELEDSPELEYVLLLGSFKNKDKLQQILEQKIYQNREYKNNIVFYSSREDVFNEQYVNKMRLVMAVKKAQEKISWSESKIDSILNKRKEELNKELKDTFGDYIYWQQQEDGWKLESETLETKLTTAELKEAVEVEFEDLKEDVSSRLKVLGGIKPEELLAEYRKFREYPVIANEEEFYQVLEELEAEEKIFVEEESNTIHISPLLIAEEKVDEFETEEAKRKLAYFVRNNIFDEEYKVFGYDKLEDGPELEYVLLFETPQEDLVEFLERELYADYEFQNSVVLLRVKNDIYTEEALAKAKKLLVLKELPQQVENLKHPQQIIDKLKSELLDLVNADSVYYEQWIKTEQGLEIKEEEVAVDELATSLEISTEDLKEHLMNNLRARDLGIGKEELFLEYRRHRDYPLLIDKSKLEETLEELVTAEKIISAEEGNKIYGSTSALIKSTVNEVDSKEAKQELVMYIRNELFNGEYKVFGYDELEDNPEVKYLLLLGSFKNKAKLKQILEQKLYQNREYQNNIILYSSREDVFNEKYVNKMRLVIGVKRAQEKMNWEKNKISRILDKRRQQLNEQLQETFGDYLYWKQEDDELQLKAKELGTKSKEELSAEMSLNLEKLKEDISNRLKELEGIDSEQLLDYYRKSRGYPIILDEDQFYQALEELKNEKRIVSENERLYSNLESLVEAKFNEISNQQAQESLVNYIKDELFSDEYKIYGYDEIPDNGDLKKVVLLNYFAEVEELTGYLLEKVYSEREYKGTLALIMPKNDLHEHVELVRKVLAIEAINSENELVIKLLKVTENKLIQKLKKSFGIYLKWKEKGDDLELQQQELELEQIKEITTTDKEAVKKYIINHLTAKIKVDELLEQLKQNLATPVIEAEDIYYEVIEELFAEDKILLMNADEELYQNEEKEVTGEMFVVDPEFELWGQEEETVDDQLADEEDNQREELETTEEEGTTSEDNEATQSSEEDKKLEESSEEDDEELEEDNYEVLDLFL